MSTTLSDLRALSERALVHADNTAILRPPEGERTVEGVARAYLARTVWVAEARPGLSALRCSVGVIGSRMRTVPLDLTDPGTAHALVVALALALGLDPGVGGVACMWVRDEPGWSVVVERGDIRFTDPLAIRRRGDPTQITACLVAREPDPIKALCLAVRHVLETP